MHCARVNRLNDYQPGAEKQRVWRERLVGVLPGRKGSRVSTVLCDSQDRIIKITGIATLLPGKANFGVSLPSERKSE